MLTKKQIEKVSRLIAQTTGRSQEYIAIEGDRRHIVKPRFKYKEIPIPNGGRDVVIVKV